MEYKVIENENLEIFQAEVNAHLLDGWALQGGVAVSVTEQSQRHYAQALVK
jgi:hypothetical protein